MHIINLKKKREHKKNRLFNLATILLGLTVSVAIVFYYGRDLHSMLGIVLLIGTLFSIEYVFFKTFHMQIFREPSRFILLEMIITLMLLFMILIESSANIPKYFLPIGSAAILLVILTSPFTAVMN